MHAHLQAYIERVRDLAGSGVAAAEKVRRILDEIGGLLDVPCLLDPPHRYLPEEGCGRHLLHRGPTHGFIVVAIVWPPGYDSKPHDHGTWGILGVLAGELRVTQYERTDDGHRDGHATLRRGETVTLARGATGHVLPPHEDHHRIVNPGPRPALSLHTYGKELRGCRVFDLERGTFELVDPVYTSVPEQALPAG